MECNGIPRKLRPKRVQLKHSNLTAAELERIQSLVAKVLLFSKGKPLRSTVAKRIKYSPINRPLRRDKETITSTIDETPENMRAQERAKRLKLHKQRAADAAKEASRSAGGSRQGQSSGFKRRASEFETQASKRHASGFETQASVFKRQAETRPEWKIWTRTERKMRAIPDKKLKTRHERHMWTIRDRQVRARPERQVSLMDCENIPSSCSGSTRERISFMDVDPTPHEDIAVPSTSRGHVSNFESSFHALDKTLSPEGSDIYYDSSADDTTEFDDDDDDYIDYDDGDDLSSFGNDSEISSDEDMTSDDENIPSSTLMPKASYSGDSERTVSMMSVEYSSPRNFSKTQFDGKDGTFTAAKFNSFENVHRNRTISFMSVEYSSPSNEDIAAYQKNSSCKKRRRTSAAAGRPSKRSRHFVKDGFSDENDLTGVMSFECVPSNSNGNPKVVVESISDYQKKWYGQIMNFEIWEQ